MCVYMQLFDLIYREETLFNVIKSVTRNGRSILLTALLALILVYLFSIVGFLCLKEDFIMEVDPLVQIAAGDFLFHFMPLLDRRQYIKADFRLLFDSLTQFSG